MKRFYDRFGARQDGQAFYEDLGFDTLAREGAFSTAHHVFEFGCGTGRFAERLLCRELPQDARYDGVDVSSTMVDLSTKRLRPFGGRANVARSEGAAGVPFPDGTFDRVIATYVLDILAEEKIKELLSDARRSLVRGGLLCTLALTRGASFPSRLLATTWSGVHALWPALVGGCRPIVVAEYLDRAAWRIRNHSVVVAWTVPSEVLVAEAVS